MAVGTVTRGTTNTNRLRRVDRWIAALPVFRRAEDPVVVDLGFGASAVTTFELHQRLSKARTDVRVVGVEIEPDRVRVANEQLARVRAGRTTFAADARVEFASGGFEVPLPGDAHATVIRAFNVLRQYDEAAVLPAWRLAASRLQPGGLLIDGTCDEIGRVASWVDVAASGPQRVTLSLRLTALERPSIVAERLPKILIHRNVDGEPVHELMTDLDRFWRYNAALTAYGPAQRWIATVQALAQAGWPIQTARTRWRLGELTVPWSALEPEGFRW